MSRSAPSVKGWLLPGRKPFGLYLYLEEVDALAAEFQDEILGKQVPHALGMYESPFPIRTKSWLASAGRRDRADHREPAIRNTQLRPATASRFRGPAS
jgi:hypothetical protein